MKIKYDRDNDALWIELLCTKSVSSLDYEPGVTAALDAHGLVIALEILDLRERVSTDDLDALTETLHLLRSRTNADRLLASLERTKARTGAPTDLAILQAELMSDPNQSGEPPPRYRRFRIDVARPATLHHNYMPQRLAALD